MLNSDSDLKRGSDVLRAAESDVNAQLAERGPSHFDLVFYILHSEETEERGKKKYDERDEGEKTH